MSAISREEVAHLARLSRIAMTDDELDHLSSELGLILESVSKVQAVAAEDIAPTSHAIEMQNVMRPDVVVPSLTTEETLSGAPAREDDRFKVPQILGEE